MNTDCLFLILLKYSCFISCFTQTVTISDVKPLIKLKTHARRLQPSTNRYLYLNYKETYGLRYEPKNIHKKRQTHVENVNDQNDVPMMVSTSPVPDMINDTTIESDGMQMVTTEIVPTTIATSSTNAPSSTSEISVTTSTTVNTTIDDKVSTTEKTRPHRQQVLSFSALLNQNDAWKRSNITKFQTIPKPESAIKQTLQLIRKRLRQWLSLGTDPKASLLNGQRFLNVFNVIKFENSPCTSTQEGLTEMSGICYHDYQCSDMGGSSIDECADGLGVCCVCMEYFFEIILIRFD